jgi:hypothetical protein
MPGMACGLLDEVKQDPTDGAGLRIGKPWLGWKRHRMTEVVDGGDDHIGASACLFVLLQDCGQRLRLGEGKLSM